MISIVMASQVKNIKKNSALCSSHLEMIGSTQEVNVLQIAVLSHEL